MGVQRFGILRVDLWLDKDFDLLISVPILFEIDLPFCNEYSSIITRTIKQTECDF